MKAAPRSHSLASVLVIFAGLVLPAAVSSAAVGQPAAPPAELPHNPGEPARAVLPTPPPTGRWDKTTANRAKAMADRAIAYLRTQQDEKSGGWSVPSKPGQPHLPAISGLVLSGMLLHPGIDATDKSVASGLNYILNYRKPDGGIYDSMLPSYNTAICLSTLAAAGTPAAKAAIPGAQDFLKRQQWGSEQPAGMNAPGPHGTEAPNQVGPDHPFFGGLGYGNRGRPDISNLAFAVQAWKDSGLPADDPAFKRAIAFLQRTQMLEAGPDGKPVNDQKWAKGSRQGGFVYATAVDDKSPPDGQSFAGAIEETLSDGTRASRLRAYGSATYLGFKSYIFAGLSPDDPRVTAAVDWARANWSLDENPDLGSDGYWYYIAAMSRAMDALGKPTIRVVQAAPLRTSVYLAQGPEGRPDPAAFKAKLESLGIKPEAVLVARRGQNRAGPGGRPPVYIAHFKTDADAAAAVKSLAGHAEIVAWQTPVAIGKPIDADWRVALVEALAQRQNPDGSFRTVDDRWMENNPVLVTAYALLALEHAAKGAEVPFAPAPPAPSAPNAPAPATPPTPAVK